MKHLAFRGGCKGTAKFKQQKRLDSKSWRFQCERASWTGRRCWAGAVGAGGFLGSLRVVC
eukprot:12549577-Alexandrium_andersonii.AAC.1